jgi:hypothetical protein
MFVAPALGKANLSAAQEPLLAGKARWLHLAAEAGLPVIPTIAITRAAWEALQAERRHQTAGCEPIGWRRCFAWSAATASRRRSWSAPRPNSIPRV